MRTDLERSLVTILFKFKRKSLGQVNYKSLWLPGRGRWRAGRDKALHFELAMGAAKAKRQSEMKPKGTAEKKGGSPKCLEKHAYILASIQMKDKEAKIINF